MKKLDRAVYAMFLLVLLADVARVHALAPVGNKVRTADSRSISGSILMAASQLQVNEAGDAILVFRRTDGAQVAQFNCSSLRFSGWSKSLAGQSGSNRHSRLASTPNSALAAAPGLRPGIVGSLPPGLSLLPGTAAVFEHTGSPAP
jgi:hypothetical protein